MSPCSLHPPHPTLSLPSHHASPPLKQTLQIAPPQPNPSMNRTTFNAQLVVSGEESSASDIGLEWDKLMDERRRQRRCARRKKRKKSLGFGDEEEGMEDDIDERWLFGSDRSRNLTKRQEAALSRYIKEEAMLQADNSQMTMESAGWGSYYSNSCSIMARRSRDKVVLRARASEERIMRNYKRLVFSIAASYQGSGLCFEDLVQEGCVGLLRGVRKFDHEKGYKLSTYVYWWIKQAIVRAIANNSRLVRLPVNLCEATGKVREANAILRSRFGRRPTYAEIADFVNLKVSSVKIIIQCNKRPLSFDQPVYNDGPTLKDIMSGPDEFRPGSIISRQMRVEYIEQLLSKLNDREQFIIRLRYGLNAERARSFDEIGRLISLTGERVRQIHTNALTKLREERSLIQCLLQCNF